MGGIGADTVKGAAVGQYVEAVSWSAGAGLTGGNSLVGNMASNFAGNIERNIGRGIVGYELSYHSIHSAAGKDYDGDCPVCNS